MAGGDLGQGDVAGVEVSHGGDEGGFPLARQGLAQFGDGVDESHQKPCSGPGNSPAFTEAT
jgi:hypothetical protein